jgi:tetratricopeptide (TPR) repeat protein
MKYSIILCLFILMDIQTVIGQTDVDPQVFINKADSLFKAFHYDSASVFYRNTAYLYESRQNWLNCAKNYRLAGDAMNKAAKYDSALFFTNKAMSIAEKHFHEDNRNEIFEKSDILLSYSDVYENKGKFDEEFLCCKKALALVINTDITDSLKIAKIWNKTGVSYGMLGKLDSALLFFGKAFGLRIKLLGENHVDVAESYSNMGKIYNNAGKYDKALENHQKALKIRTSVLGEMHPYVAGSYNNIGIIYRKKGEFDKALEYYQKALKIRISVFGEMHPDVSGSYHNIGIIYREKGDYDKALECYQKTLKIDIATFGELHPYVASSYDHIGVVYGWKGDYDKALDYHQKALKIHIAIYGESHPVVAGCYNNLGIMYDIKGDYDIALEYFQKTLKIRLSALGEMHPDVAIGYINIGVIYFEKGDYDKALEYYQKALKIDITTFGEIHPEVAASYTNIGNIYNAKKKYDKALESYQKAQEILISAFGEIQPDVASGYNNIGLIYYERQDYFKALSYYQKALMANLPEFHDTSIYTNAKIINPLSKPVLVTSLAAKAYMFYLLYKHKTNSRKDIEASLSNYELAFQLINNMRNESNFENTKLLLSETTKNRYSNAVHAAVELGKLNQTAENDNFSKAFEFIEKCKSATLAGRFNEYNAMHYAGVTDSLIEVEKKLEKRSNELTIEINKEKYKKGAYDTLRVNYLENENFVCARKIDSLISSYESNFPVYYELKYSNKIVSVNEIQKSLDQRTALINYFIGDSNLFIATITDSIYHIEEIKVDSSFKSLVTKYYKDIKTAEIGLFVQNSQRIYEKLFKPVSKYIGNKKNLIIIPDDYLYYVPFETLIANTSEITSRNIDFTKLGYLIKSRAITYNHSATIWYNTWKKQLGLTSKHKDSFIGFAPVFSKEKNNGMILSSNINTIDTTEHNLAYRSISADLKRFNPLPYSKDEVTAIVHLFEKHNKDARAYLYSEATESNFKHNTFNYKYVHISSHGFANDKAPKLSGVVFSQLIDTLDSEDGVLYSGETYDLSLNADLVVLSSCESGIGKLINGEGLQALSRGFLYAGAPNVVFSLWKALDEPTKNLMIQFYTNVLDGSTYAESLRHAKLDLIKNPATAFPHFWGGFVLVGR